MKTVRFLLLPLATAVLFSCTRKAVPEECVANENLQTISLSVGLEDRDPSTRTYVSSGRKVHWHYNAESISVFTAPGVQFKFSKPVGESNVFSGSLSSVPSEFVAVYPYSEANDMKPGSSVAGYEAYDYCVTTSVPGVQEAVPGTFTMDTYPAAAASSKSSFTMYGLAGGLRITPGAGDIKYIVVRGNSGEALSGPLTAGLSLSDPIPGSFTMDSAKGFGNVVLCDPWRGEALSPSDSYFIVLPPVKFTKGFTLYFVDSKGAVARVTTDKELEIKRASFSRITNLGEKMEAFVTPSPVDLGLSVQWSSCDIGTLDPLDPGIAVPWGLTLPRLCTESDYPSFSFGELPLSGDAANATLGGNWRTPTQEEFKELAEKCSWSRIAGGWKVTSKVNGNSIEFPDVPHWTATRGYEFKDGSLSAWDAPYLRKSVRPVLSSGSVITFADSNLEAVLVAAFDKDGDGHLSNLEAAGVTYDAFSGVSWGDVTRFTSFDEFKYFTGLGGISQVSFSGWSGLKSIVLPSGMTKVPRFDSCTSLASVELPEGLEEIYPYAFSRCSSLESLTIPSGLKRIGSNAFYMCKKLESLVIPGLDDWLKVEVGSGGHPFSASRNGRLYADGKEITEVAVPSWCTSVPANSFCGCTGVRSFSLHGAVKAIGDGAFQYCSQLTGLDLPAGIETIGSWAFANCMALKSIVIPEGLTSIGINAFDSCSKMESISLPSSLKAIGSGAFTRCGNLTKLSVSDLKSWCSVDIGVSGHPFEGLFSGGGHLFAGGSEVTSLVIPSGVEAISDECFTNCSFITTLTASSGLKTIGADAFKGCAGLVSVQMPSTLQGIGDSVFSRCTSLASVSLPSSLQTLGASSFSGCSSLESLVIPEGVTAIGARAFAYSGLKSLDVKPSTPPAAGENLFDGLIAVSIYVPASSVGAYKGASGWSSYSSWIQAKP